MVFPKKSKSSSSKQKSKATKKTKSKLIVDMVGSKLYRIEAPHFVAGFVSDLGKCRVAAPIIRWMVGKSVKEIKVYCQRKNWKIERRENDHQSLPR